MSSSRLTPQETSKVIQSKKEDLGESEDIGAQMEEAMILDNKWVFPHQQYTEQYTFLEMHKCIA